MLFVGAKKCDGGNRDSRRGESRVTVGAGCTGSRRGIYRGAAEVCKNVTDSFFCKI